MKSILRRLVVILNRAVISPVLSTLHKTCGLELQIMYTARIGHLCFNTCVYFYNLVNSDRGGSKRMAFLIGADPCNRQLFDMWKRYLPAIESRIVLFWFNADLDYLLEQNFIDYIPFLHTEFKEIDQAPALAFTPSEEVLGQQILEDMGLTSGDWFVCFQSRDSAYQEQIRSAGENRPRLHSNIDTYLDAARLVTDLGGHAIRMGWGVSEPIETDGNAGIIDYASNFRSDFGDIYLSGKCRFTISTTGMFAVPPLFKIPVIFANSFPLRLWQIGSQSMVVPKLFKDKDTDTLVPASVLSEYGALSYVHDDMVRWREPATVEGFNLAVIDNSADDISNAARDMFDQLDGRLPSPEAREIQEFFKRKYCTDVPDGIEHGPNIAPSFAVKYQDVLCA